MTLEELATLAEVPPADRAQAWDKAQAASRSPDREIRTAASEAIAAVASPDQAYEALSALARDPDVGVRYAAVAALAGLPWRMRFAPLRSALEDSDLGIVAVAADGLSYAGDRRAAPVLRELLDERRLRFGAMEGLFALQDQEFVAFARQLFREYFTPVFDRAIAALALARTGDADARTFLHQRLGKKFGEERHFIVAHLLSADPVQSQSRDAIEQIARTPGDACFETALLALTRIDPTWWPVTEESITRNLEPDPYAAAETLLGLFDIDWQRSAPLAEAHAAGPGLVGSAAMKIRLGVALREQFRHEVQLRCD